MRLTIRLASVGLLGLCLISGCAHQQPPPEPPPPPPPPDEILLSQTVVVATVPPRRKAASNEYMVVELTNRSQNPHTVIPLLFQDTIRLVLEVKKERFFGDVNVRAPAGTPVVLAPGQKWTQRFELKDMPRAIYRATGFQTVLNARIDNETYVVQAPLTLASVKDGRAMFTNRQIIRLVQGEESP